MKRTDEPFAIVDNSIIKCYRDCPRKCYYEYALGIDLWKTPRMEGGKVGHIGLDAWYSKDPNWRSAMTAKASPMVFTDKKYNLDLYLKVLNWYTQQVDPLKPLATEIGFSIDLGGGYYYGGIIDLVAEHPAYDGVVIVDHKFTEAPAYYSNNITLNRQLSGYIVAGALAYGNCSNGMFNLIDIKNTKIVRLPAQRDEKALDSWIVETKFYIDQIRRSVEKKLFPRTDSCGSTWRPCPFIPYCTMFPDSLPTLEDFPMSEFKTREKAWEPWYEGNTIKEISI